MKRFDDLSEPEIVALSDADISRWIDLECAYEGAPLLPPCPVPPVRVFSLAHWNTVRKDAEAFTAKKSSYDQAHKEYVDIEKKRERVTRWIHERVEDLHAKERERESLRVAYARYL